MWKSLVAGLMCVGIVSIGVALSRGEDSEAQPAEGQIAPAAAEQYRRAAKAAVEQEAGKLVEIHLGSDEGLTGTGDLTAAEGVEDQEIVVIDGENSEKRNGPVRLRLSRQAGGPQVLDPATREAVEKMVAGLNDEAKRLAAEGKSEESAKKAQSAQALGRLLAGGIGAYRSQFKRINSLAASHEQAPGLERLHGVAERLVEQIGDLKGVGKLEEASKLEQELAEIKQKIGEMHKRMFFIARQGPAGTFPGPHAHAAQGNFVYGPTGIFPGPHPQVAGFAFAGSPEAEALMHKAEALSEAAAKLREAGLEDKARDIARQADETRAKAETMRAAAVRVAGGPPGFPGGPHAGELQRSIRELQEQVQLLRKEVAEVRELLQRRP